MARSVGPSGVVCPQPATTLPRLCGQGPSTSDSDSRSPTPAPIQSSGPSHSPGPSQGLGWTCALALVAPGLTATLALVAPGAALAGPVVCVSSLEAPLPVKGAAASAFSSLSPVVVTRCGPVVTTPQLVERRAYGWTAPFAQGVDLVHQFTDALGIAVAGRDGSTVMGLGFPDQTLVWDGTAIEATNRVLLEAQSNPMPVRSGDVFNGFCSGLAQGGCGLPMAEASLVPSPRMSGLAPTAAPVRGLW